MANQFNNYSFEQWCKDTNNILFLDLWNYKLNKKNPNEVGYKSNKKYWFDCKRKIHKPDCIRISTITNTFDNTGKQVEICKRCNSLGQHIIDEYGFEYLNKIW